MPGFVLAAINDLVSAPPLVEKTPAKSHLLQFKVEHEAFGM
jgi:hypothetical protein